MPELSIFESLRQGRLDHKLNQTELARKLGIRQSQVSDLERAAVDPRLSTVQDVARVLDFELMLIPRRLIPAVKGLVRTKDVSANNRPVYALDDANEAQENED